VPSWGFLSVMPKCSLVKSCRQSTAPLHAQGEPAMHAYCAAISRGHIAYEVQNVIGSHSVAIGPWNSCYLHASQRRSEYVQVSSRDTVRFTENGRDVAADQNFLASITAAANECTSTAIIEEVESQPAACPNSVVFIPPERSSTPQ
jgi:hypothetical protein